MIISVDTAKSSINILLHMFILFSFLTIFYFVYISNLEKNTIRHLVKKMIYKEVDSILNNIQSQGLQIDKKMLNMIANKIDKTQIQGDINHNNKLRRNAIIIILVIVVVITLLVLYYKFRLGYNLNMNYIIIMNIVVFVLIGIVEYIFYTNIALKYTPVKQSDISSSVIEDISNYIEAKIN